MEPSQLPPSQSGQDIQEPQRDVSATPKISFVRKHSSIMVLILLVLVIGGVAGVIFFSHHKGQTPHPTISATAPKDSGDKISSENVWKGASISATAIPLGDGKISSTAQVGYIDSCTTSFRGGGARHAGSWINTADNTWDSQTKVAVEGSVTWPAADYSATTSASNRLITTNDLPEIYPTGIFPIGHSDPAYQFDTNPNHIGTQNLSYSIPFNPSAAASPGCLPLGPIGVLSDGVLLFDALDDAGRDAVAHETQDLCNSHPNGKEMYHYHNVASCIRNKATGSSTLVGYAFDGYGIYVERDASGNLPTNADLDACHGHTSQVEWNGTLTDVYHYDATLEYPYTIGCFHGTSAVKHGPA